METPPEDDPAAVESIRRFLEWKNGEFGLLIATCNDAATRDAAIRELARTSTGTQLLLALPEGTADPLEIPLHAILGQPPAALHLVQLERSVPSDESNIAPLHALNLRRGQWEKLGCPVVLWVPDYLLGLLLRHAPDFSSWRSGSPRVATVGSLASSGASASLSLDSGDADLLFHPPFSDSKQRPIRLAELEERLAAYPDVVPAAALGWLGEAALLYALEKRPLDARHAAARFYNSLSNDQMPVWFRFMPRLARALGMAGSIGEALRTAGEYRDAAKAMATNNPEDRRFWLIVGSAYLTIGNILVESGETRKALAEYEKALAIAREIGDKHGEGSALGNLGNVYFFLGDAEKTIEYCEEQLQLARQISDRNSECNALSNIGLAHFSLGNPYEAIEFNEKALLVSRETANRRGECAALGNLGTVHLSLGDVRKAVGYLDECLAIAREIGDRREEGGALGNLGNANVELGHPLEAIGYYEKRLVIAREIGDRRSVGTALWNSAMAYESLGQREKAVALLNEALVILEAIEDPYAGKIRKTLTRWKTPAPADA